MTEALTRCDEPLPPTHLAVIRWADSAALTTLRSTTLAREAAPAAEVCSTLSFTSGFGGS